MTKFKNRHIGPSETEIESILSTLKMPSVDQLIDETVPDSIRSKSDLNINKALTEEDLLENLKKIMNQNTPFKSYIGLGYYNTYLPTVIQRNIFENPGWYTQYTPYQAEISQGRLESLLNFQTMVGDLTGLEIANASLLDEATACAEAMMMCHAVKGKDDRNVFVAATDCHPQNLEVLQTRAAPLGIEVRTVATDVICGGTYCVVWVVGSAERSVPICTNQ